LLASLNEALPAHRALTKLSPVAIGVHTTTKLPSEPVFTDVRLSHSSPPVTLYEINTCSPEIAPPLYVSLPAISTLRSVEVDMLLQETSMVGVSFVGEGVGDGVGVGSGVGVGVGVGSGVAVGVGVGEGAGDDARFILIITIVSESSTAM